MEQTSTKAKNQKSTGADVSTRSLNGSERKKKQTLHPTSWWKINKFRFLSLWSTETDEIKNNKKKIISKGIYEYIFF